MPAQLMGHDVIANACNNTKKFYFTDAITAPNMSYCMELVSLKYARRDLKQQLRVGIRDRFDFRVLLLRPFASCSTVGGFGVLQLMLAFASDNCICASCPVDHDSEIQCPKI